MAKKKPTSRPQMNWRVNPEDEQLLTRLKAKLGVSDSDIIRIGIRRLAEQEFSSESKAAD